MSAGKGEGREAMLLTFERFAQELLPQVLKMTTEQGK